MYPPRLIPDASSIQDSFAVAPDEEHYGSRARIRVRYYGADIIARRKSNDG